MNRSAIAVVLLALLALAAALVGGGPAGASPGTTELVSVDSAGTQGNDASSTAAISADGRYVAFLSLASNLVSGDTNDKQDVFVRDRQAGTTELASVSGVGEQGNDDTWELAISADGCHVAFGSLASNLVPGDTNHAPDIFVHDCQTAITERVSVDNAGNEANEGGSYPAISGDGRFVAFDSSASNLVPGDTNDSGDVFVHDRQTGITERVSVDSAGNEANDWSAHADISPDGRFVAFDSGASNLVSGDTNAYMDTFVHDRQTGMTERVSVDSAGNQQDVPRRDVMYSIGYPAISADGRLVAFVSPAFNLVPGDTNDGEDIFVHDRQTGITERVSVSSVGGDQGNGLGAAISADGRYVAFQSGASSLAPGDTNDAWDVFVHDRQTGSTQRVSVDSAGNQANGGSSALAISADGRFVTFSSSASNLVPGDTNNASDVFVHDRGPSDDSATVTTSLAAGWNHVCYIGAERPVEAALDDIADSVQAMYRIGAGGAWDRWFAGSPQASTMETVRPYDPLLVLTSESLTWTQTRDEFAPDTVDLEQGWNARCYEGEDEDIDEAVKGVQGQVTIVYALIPGQGWLRYVPDRPEIGTLERLQRHQAVLVLVTDSAGAVWRF